ncbi:MAG: NAD-dependent epimerase/dehydratase family protein [Geminicoccaceae bacterium]|nr:MAG: NAD-dependent epimerase/dehydratase family protein [Geminicoccaceae bacterium]
MSRHVILGGTGFLGRHVARALERAGDHVRVVGRGELSEGGSGELDRLLQAADVVHHYAWATVPGSAALDPVGDLGRNIALTLGILEAMRRRGGGRLLFSSSGGSVYGRLRIVPAPEDHPLWPLSAYAIAKATAEHYCQLYHALHGVDVWIARIGNLYGGGQDPERGFGAATTFASQALAGRTLEIWGDGKVVRDYIHVADATAGLIRLAAAPAMKGASMPVYNLGSGVGVSLLDLVHALESQLGRAIDYVHRAARPYDVPVSVLDIGAARRDLAWAPNLDLAAGLELTIADLRADPSARFASPFRN